MNWSISIGVQGSVRVLGGGRGESRSWEEEAGAGWCHSHQSQDCLCKNPWAGDSPPGHRTKDRVAWIRAPFLTSAQIRLRVCPVCVLLHQEWSEKVTELSLGLSVWLFWKWGVVANQCSKWETAEYTFPLASGCKNPNTESKEEFTNIS